MEGGARRSACPLLPALREAVCDTQCVSCFQLSSGQALGCFPLPLCIDAAAQWESGHAGLSVLGNGGVYLAVAYQGQVIVMSVFRCSFGYLRPVLRDKHFQVFAGPSHCRGPFSLEASSQIVRKGQGGPGCLYKPHDTNGKLTQNTMILTYSLYSPGWPETHCIDQAGPELTEICLLLLPQCWDGRIMPLH